MMSGREAVEVPVDVVTGQQTCINCAHKRCMFSGEDRKPVYRGEYPRGVYCWIDPSSDLGAKLLSASKVGNRRD